MAALNLAQVADGLYGLAPAEFRAARDESARQQRDAGHRDLASAISKLRRPTVSAWLVNQLVREVPDEVSALLRLGEPLRVAQQELAGERLRELAADRRRALASLTQHAKRLAAGAGQSMTVGVEREVRATLEAALADPAATEAVRSGQLTSALAFTGLGGLDLGDAVAVPAAQERRPARSHGARAGERPSQPGTRAARPGKGGKTETEQRPGRATAGTPSRAARGPAREAAAAERAAQEATAAESDLRDAAAMARQAEAALAEAERRVAAARERQGALRRRIEGLEQQLAESEAEMGAVARSVRDARRDRDAAARSRDEAGRRLARAKARADRLR